MRVLGVKRDIDEPVAHVESLHPPEAIDELVEQADAIVVTLPLTDETRGLIGRRTIGRMRQGAIVVNVGRGGVIDEEALVEALGSGRLAVPRSTSSPRSRCPRRARCGRSRT